MSETPRNSKRPCDDSSDSISEPSKKFAKRDTTLLNNLLQNITIPKHYVYALVLLLNGAFDIDSVFYIGEAESLNDRLLDHKNDSRRKNKYKYDIIKNNPDCIRMIKLYTGEMATCKFIEKLLIQYREKLDLNLTNDLHSKHEIYDIPGMKKNDVIQALSELLNSGIKRNDGINDKEVKATPERKEKQQKTRKSRACQRAIKSVSDNFKKSKFSSSLIKPLNMIVKKNVQPSTFSLPDETAKRNYKNLKKDNLLNKPSKSIVDVDTILNYDSIPGTFYDLAEEQIKKLLEPTERAIVFAARIGAIANKVKCRKCKRDMKISPRKDGTMGYRWMCPCKCQNLAITDGTFLEHRGVSVSTILLSVYYFSRGFTSDEIVTKLGNVPYTNKIYGIINCFTDEIVKIELGKCYKPGDDLLKMFFENKELDHFGVLLYWLAGYKSSKNSV